MEIIEVNSEAYKAAIQNSYFYFGSATFNKLNENNASSVHYLLFKDSKVRLGLIVGVRDQSLFSPFSAPYGGFSFVKADVKLQAIESALEELHKWAAEKKISTIKIILPPDIYHSSFIAKQTNVLYRMNYSISETDLNFSFNLDNFNENYAKGIWRNARKNLNKSLKNDLFFELCNSDNEKQTAYSIIKQNRSLKGFPLRMTWEQIKNTINVIPAWFFLVKDKVGKPIASAIVFQVADKVLRVIYWGDLPEYAHLKTMNFLTYKVFEFFKEIEMQFMDIGISTENTIPNYGLCEFKESIGCDISPNFTFIKNI